MTNLNNILLQKEILLESGTNELELLVFQVADYLLGINVAKVREVLPVPRITTLPSSHHAVRGVFQLRDRVVPCVSLADHLGVTTNSPTPESMVVLTDYNQQQTAFLVDSIDRIYRMSWEAILTLPSLEELHGTPVTGIVRHNGDLIILLDFEKILDDISEHRFRAGVVANPLNLPRETVRIALADDSATIRDCIGTTLRESGYTQLSFFTNGAETWNWLIEQLAEKGRIEEFCDLVISDVEMPQVDGLHLTKRIKEHPVLRHLPVLLYSSIMTPENQKKAQAVGADAQISKPEMDELVRLADELTCGDQAVANSARRS